MCVNSGAAIALVNSCGPSDFQPGSPTVALLLISSRRACCKIAGMPRPLLNLPIVFKQKVQLENRHDCNHHFENFEQSWILCHSLVIDVVQGGAKIVLWCIPRNNPRSLLGLSKTSSWRKREMSSLYFA